MATTQGSPLNACPIDVFSDGFAEAVTVTGAGWNPCGHALLGTQMGYFHIAGVFAHPYFLNAIEYDRYLVTNHKKEVKRARFVLPRPAAARARLCTLLSENWLWGVLPHNCVRFVEEVLQAGGVDAALNGNCPLWEDF